MNWREWLLGVAFLDVLMHLVSGFIYLLMCGFEAAWIPIPLIQNAAWSQIAAAEVMFYIFSLVVLPPK